MGFRFHTGSIKSAEEFDISYNLITGFDSILVRLKVNHTLKELSNLVFRFHTGSIKSRDTNIHASCIQIGFDSILVRLKDEIQFRIVFDGPMFRFHTGSIKRHAGNETLYEIR